MCCDRDYRLIIYNFFCKFCFAFLQIFTAFDFFSRPYLTIGEASEFVLGGNRPLSYTQVRRMCERIKKDTGFTENITPKRFRPTVLTDLYDQTRDIKLVQAAAGHTTAEMTLKHYVKGRGDVVKSAAAIESVYTA